MANPQQELFPNGTEYYRLFSPLGSPGGSAKGVLAKGLAALAALAMAAAGFFHLYVDCVPLDITSTTALLETQLYNLEEGQEVSWFLMEGSDLTKLPPPEDWELTLLLDLLTRIFLEDLEPVREYTIVYTTPGEDGVPEIVHTFTFRTPTGPPNLGPPEDSGSGGSEEPPTPPTPPETPPVTPPDPPKPPADPPKVPQITPPAPPPGGGDDYDGGGNDGGDSNPPAKLPPSFIEAGSGFQEPGYNNYFLVFPFYLNGSTFKSFHVEGNIHQRDSLADPVTEQTISLDYTDKTADEFRIDEDRDFISLWYEVPGAFSDATLTATMTYIDQDGNEQTTDPYTASYSAPYLTASGSNTLTAQIDYNTRNVVFTAEIGAYHPGSGDLGFQITEVQLNGTPYSIDSVSGKFKVTFTVPLDVLPNGTVTATITGCPVFGSTPLDYLSSTTTCSTQVFASVGPIVAPSDWTINGIHCSSIEFSGGESQISSVVVGSTVTLYFNFTGFPSPSSFLLSPTITSSTLSNLTVSSVQVEDLMPVTVMVTFTMPGHDVTTSDFTFVPFPVVTSQEPSNSFLPSAEPEEILPPPLSEETLTPSEPAALEEEVEEIPSDPAALEEDAEEVLPDPPALEEEPPTDPPAT